MGRVHLVGILRRAISVAWCFSPWAPHVCHTHREEASATARLTTSYINMQERGAKSSGEKTARDTRICSSLINILLPSRRAASGSTRGSIDLRWNKVYFRPLVPPENIMLIIRRPLIITIFLYKLISPLGSPAAVEASTAVMELYMDARIGEMTDTTNNQLFEGDFRF